MLLHRTSHGFSEESLSNDEWRPAKNQYGSLRVPDVSLSLVVSLPANTSRVARDSEG